MMTSKRAIYLITQQTSKHTKDQSLARVFNQCYISISFIRIYSLATDGLYYLPLLIFKKLIYSHGVHEGHVNLKNYSLFLLGYMKNLSISKRGYVPKNIGKQDQGKQAMKHVYIKNQFMVNLTLCWNVGVNKPWKLIKPLLRINQKQYTHTTLVSTPQTSLQNFT